MRFMESIVIAAMSDEVIIEAKRRG